MAKHGGSRSAVETLRFLSDDSYEFTFQQAKAPVQPRELYFPELIDAFQENDEVAVFSGGVDSFAGAVNDIVALGKSVTLVGHYSSTKVRNVQEALICGLKQRVWSGASRTSPYGSPTRTPDWQNSRNERGHSCLRASAS